MFKRFQITTVAIATLAFALAGFVPASFAVNVIWTGATDTDWSDSSNWNAPVPGTGDTAFIIDGAVTAATVSTDVDLINGVVDGVHVGQGGGDGAVEIVAGGNLTTGLFNLGSDGGRNGTLNMTGGTLTSTGNLQVGASSDVSASLGTATISGGAISVATTLFVSSGTNAAGSSFTQSGGTLAGDFDGDGDVDNNDLTDPTLGWNARYGVDLDGGDFLTWQQQFGMSSSASSVTADNVHVGENSVGSYTLNGGTLTINHVAASFEGLSIARNIGSSGSTFTHNGGTIDSSGGHLAVGVFAQGTYSLPTGSTGVVNLNGGGQLLVGNEAGSGGSLFDQDGGTVNSSTLTIIGRAGGAASTYDISGGALNSPTLHIGTSTASSGSSFIQSGGTVTLSSDMSIGVGGGGTGGAGSYSMSGGLLDMTGVAGIIQVGGGADAAGSSLTVSGGTLNSVSINPGAFAQGTMTVSGTGDVNVSQNLQVGATAAAAGSVLNQSGGTLDAATIFLGVGGSASFNLSGGATTLGSLNVAQGSTGTVTQTGGSMTSFNILVGVTGTGTYDLSVGSVVTNANGVFSVGRGNAGGTGNGTLNMSGGSITGDRLDIGGDILVATDTGTGVVNMSAGTINTTGGVTLDTIAPNPGSSGELNLSGTASYTTEAISVGDNLLLFDGTLAGKTAGGTGLLSIDGSNVNLSLAGVWIGATGTLEMVADASGVSTIVTTGGAHAVGGGTFLLGALDIDLSAIASNADLTLIDNTDALAGVLGTFTGLAEGATFMDSSGTKNATISYVGGVGSNDVVLTGITDIPALGAATVPEPASAMMLLVGLAGLASARRRRRGVA